MTPPILLIVFNRPDTTAAVVEAIRQARPSRLYIAADGPRSNKPGEQAQCAQTRQIATQVDWPCDLRTLFRDTNLGCREAVSGAINWFFQCEPEGIVLEDDCLPHPSFFQYCAYFLNVHREDDRVMSIAGSSFFRPLLRSRAYCYTYYADMWGWASWRRAWTKYDVRMTDWPESKFSLADRFPHRPCTADYWSWHFDEVYRGAINTWDYQWIWRILKEDGLVVTPMYNMIRNLGFGPDATHTTQADWRVGRRALEAFPTPISRAGVPVRRDTGVERYIELCRLSVSRRGLSDRIIGRARRIYGNLSTYGALEQNADR